VLPLTFDDISRAFILLESLAVLERGLVREMLIFVPPREVLAVQKLLLGVTHTLSFPVSIASERKLLDPLRIETHSAYPYAVQMALKLLASELVSTPFYVTLDADVVLLRPFLLRDLLDARGRGLYHHEPRLRVHPFWWSGSETYLQVRKASEAEAGEQGFGVTPAVMSTYGARLTLERLAGQSSAAASERPPLETWITDFGRDGVVWSEYTLYAVTLHSYQVGGLIV
jgi:hypothetical protein